MPVPDPTKNPQRTIICQGVRISDVKATPKPRISNEKLTGLKHFSRFPEELPRRCIQAYGALGDDVIVLDPFSGSGTTGVAARLLGCSYLGFEIDQAQVAAANERLAQVPGASG